MPELYDNIAKLSKRAGFSTLSEMCDAAHVARATMTELRKGRTQTLSSATAEKLCSVLNVTLDELYGRKEKTATDNGDGLPDLSSASEKQRELIQRILSYSDEQVSAFLLLTQSPQDGQ